MSRKNSLEVKKMRRKIRALQAKLNPPAVRVFWAQRFKAGYMSYVPVQIPANTPDWLAQKMIKDATK